MKHLKKVLLALFAMAALAAVFAVLSAAAPAREAEQIFTQPGGAQFYGTPYGDEFFHYVKARDGALLVKGEDGVWVHAGTGARYLLDDAPAGADAQAWIAGQIAANPAPDRELPEQAEGPGLQAWTGDQPLLVLLAEFRDAQIQYESQWASLVFGTGAGSVKSFYSDATGGKINLVPVTESYGTANDGIVRVTLNFNHPGGGDKITREAIAAADRYINFASYDRNKDLRITPDELHILVICAGYEGSYDDEMLPNVWGHRTSTSQFGLADGRSFNAYIQVGEVHQSTGSSTGHLSTIGILCHELGHDFGLPDLYASTGSSGRGLGGFSLMANGSWGWVSSDRYQGQTPVYFDAYCLERLGICPVTQLNPAASYTGELRSISTGTKNILRVNLPGSAEYFLIENRQLERNDLAMRGFMDYYAMGGLAVYRINTNYKNNIEDGRQVAILLEADGRAAMQKGEIHGIDPFYYIDGSRQTLLHRLTTPSTRLQSGGNAWFSFNSESVPGTAMNLSVTGILSASPASLTIDYRSGTGKITANFAADPGPVTYVPGNPGLVTVANGNVSAVRARGAKGTTNIVVSDGSGFTDTVSVTVRYAWWQWLIVIFLFGWIWY